MSKVKLLKAQISYTMLRAVKGQRAMKRSKVICPRLMTAISSFESHFGSTNQIKGQRSRGQRFNGSPKLNVRAQIRSKLTCPRLIPAMSSIETSLLNSVHYIISLILETLISHFRGCQWSTSEISNQ